MAAATIHLPNPLHPSFIERLDEDFVEYYNENIAIKPATHTINLAEVRENPKKFAWPWCKDYSDLPFVKDIKIASGDGFRFTARTYHPDSERFGPGPFPVHINFHGGGFCFGDLTSEAEWCMLVRNEVGIIILDVDYRLTPEFAFGKGAEDAWAALQWVHSHALEINGRSDSISIGGISAGGFISCVVQQLAGDANLPLKLAILSVPSTSTRRGLKKPSDFAFPSMAENALAPVLDWKRVMFFAATIEKSLEGEDPEKRPFFWRSPIDAVSLKGVCTTFIATASCDPVRDEGEAYGRKLSQAGTKVTIRRYTGVPHAFMLMKGLKKSDLYNQDTCEALRAAHGL